MRKIFPEMTESLNKGLIFCIFVYWLFCFVIFPFLMPIVAYGVWNNLQLVSWIELIYHAINGLVLAGILKQHLADAFLSVQIDSRGILRTVLIAVGLMVLWMGNLWLLTCGMAGITFGSANEYYKALLGFFPISEMSVALAPGMFIDERQLLGSISMTVLAPFTVTGLFYATSFGPVCCRRPRLAYVVVSAVLLIPALFDIFWRGDALFVLVTYFVSLPIHWLACWSYQKADSLWAPIFSLAIFNLLLSLANIFL